MKYINIIVLTAILMTACKSMDDKYKEFVDDGPIIYIAKVSEVTVVGERNRVHFSWPPSNDPRGTKAKIYWSNRTKSAEVDIDPAKETQFYVNNLEEGSYIFEIVILDAKGNSSISTTVAGVVYGNIYEQYLINRGIIGRRTNVNGKIEIILADVTDPAMRRTEIEWQQNGQSYKIETDTATTVVLDGFDGGSFFYRSVFVPGKEDEFKASYTYNLPTPDAGTITYDSDTKKFTFPNIHDDNLLGYEMRWIDRFTLQQKTHRLNGYEAVIPDYQSAEFSYIALYRYNGQELISGTRNTKLTSTRTYLNRTNWYIPLETRPDGTEIAQVSVVSNPTTSLLTPSQLNAYKLKSPYLSHHLPYNSNTANDGLNNPRAHIDGKSTTYLSMVKGRGTTGPDAPLSSTGTFGGHFSAGIGDIRDDIYFIIDLGAQQEFDYFKITYRNGAQAAGLKPQLISFYGSNDPECITDLSKWTVIQERIVPPNCEVASNVGLGADTGNVPIPFSNYRYFKMSYVGWLDVNNTMQIEEFYLGGTVY